MRRVSQVVVWTVFVLVLWMRLLHQPEPGFRGGGGWAPWNQGNRAGGGEAWGWGGRRVTRVQPPVSAVPADLWRLSIEVAPADVKKLKSYHWGGPRGGGGGAVERPEVRATVHEGGVVYTNVALHLKGSAGSFQAFDYKPALTLNFTKHASGQRFHGFSNRA